MNIAPNTYNLAVRVEYALAVFHERNPDLSGQMYWDACEVRMSSRLRRCAGRCKYYRKLDKLVVEFGKSLFDGMTELEKTETVSHELAHAVCFRLGVGDNHDARWKRVCVDLGGDGKRLCRSNAMVKRNKVKRIVVTDRTNPQSLMVVTRNRASRLQCLNRNFVSLGCIAVNLNNKTYKWEGVVQDYVREIKVLKEDAGWKLEA